MCSNFNETVGHLFLGCCYVQQVWDFVLRSIRGLGVWKGDSIDDGFSSCFNDAQNPNFKALPVIVSWGIWLSRNAIIFQEKFTLLEIVARNSVAILGFYPVTGRMRGLKMICPEEIDRGRPYELIIGFV